MTTSAYAQQYRPRPLPGELAEVVRATRRSPDYEHPVFAEVATSPAPCRVCLAKFRPGEERRLRLTYDPFRNEEPGWPLPGPIFIHEAGCRPFAGHALPRSIAGDRLTLTAYRDDRIVVAEARTASADEAHAALDRLFGLARTRYVHVRSTPNGCFICQLDRLAD
jgi:hypothetical protein